MVSEATARLHRGGLPARVAVAELHDLPFADACFDGVRCERVLQHADEPLAALHELARVVRPGGRLVTIDPDRGVFAMDFPGWDPDVSFRLGQWNAEAGPVRNGYIARQVRRHLLGLGFSRVDAHPFVETSTAQLERRPHVIEQVHRDAVAAGVITADEAASRTTAVLAALEAGTLLSTTLFWMTVGTKA
jgi:ubiquinone/menaquinone biosynthesis C-methylase UbiE